MNIPYAIPQTKDHRLQRRLLDFQSQGYHDAFQNHYNPPRQKDGAAARRAYIRGYHAGCEVRT